MAKPDDRDDAAALMVVAVMVLIVIGMIGAGIAAFVSYGDAAGGF
jgi:hypothetical protein